MSKKGGRQKNEAAIKIHNLAHPDVTDTVLDVRLFAEACKRIVVENAASLEAEELHDLTAPPRDATADDVDMDEESFQALKSLMDPKTFLVDEGIPSAEAPPFSLLRDKLVLFRETAGVSGNSLPRPLPLCSFEGRPEDKTRLSPHEILVSVSFFQKKKKRKDFEYLLLGSQTLTHMKDTLLCPNEFLPTFNCSHLSLEEAKKAIKRDASQCSGYFLINNTFYNDTRPGCTDYSKPIRAWVQKKDVDSCSRLDNFTAADMHLTRLIDLKLRLGFPYLFCHSGDCEHLIIFNQIRMLHPSDAPCLEDYPQLLYNCKRQTRECAVCRRAKAVWITSEDHLALEDPCLFCDSCYIMLHKNSRGQNLYVHKAYPFVPFVTSDMLSASSNNSATHN